MHRFVRRCFSRPAATHVVTDFSQVRKNLKDPQSVWESSSPDNGYCRLRHAPDRRQRWSTALIPFIRHNATSSPNTEAISASARASSNSTTVRSADQTFMYCLIKRFYIFHQDPVIGFGQLLIQFRSSTWMSVKSLNSLWNRSISFGKAAIMLCMTVIQS